MSELEAVRFVCCLGYCTTLPQNARQIFDSEKRVSFGILSGGKREKFLNIRRMGHRLVGLQRCIKPYTQWSDKRTYWRVASSLLTRERGIVFNPVMQADLLQIERISAVVLVQRTGSVVAHIVTERSAKVVRRMDMFRDIGKLDISSTTRNDS